MDVLKFNDATGVSPIAESSHGEPAIYGSFFGIRERPFTLTPNPRFLYLSVRQSEALSTLRYALSTHSGFTLLTGEAGCGKTTIIRAALADFGDANIQCVLLSNPTLTRGEFYEFLSRAFGLSEQAAASKARFLEEWTAHLKTRFAHGGFTGLVVDEAQSLSHEILEEIRLLGNIETASAKLFNIVLAGQPELEVRLEEPALRALKQRIALRSQLKTFDLLETAAYIAGRLRIAGGLPQDIFTQEAIKAIYEATRGLPRTVNVLCENALISGFAVQVKPVPSRIVAEVASEFDMRAKSESVEAPTNRAESAATEPVEHSGSDVPGDPLPGTVTRPKKRFSFF